MVYASVEANSPNYFNFLKIILNCQMWKTTLPMILQKNLYINLELQQANCSEIPFFVPATPINTVNDIIEA